MKEYKIDPVLLIDKESKVVELKKIIDASTLQRAEYEKEEQYYLGQNTAIKNRPKSPDPSVPDWQITNSYGRKLIKTISGYMYSPGLITYETEDEKLKDIYKLNNEDIENNNLGIYQGVNGIVYELHYTEAAEEGVTNRFTMVKAADGISIYDYKIEKNLIAFIRIYTQGTQEFYETYFKNEIQIYTIEANTKKLIPVGEPKLNVFGRVPVIVFRNNDNDLSDIKPVIDLIDAYDVLVSDSMNEFDRFAWAYLKIVGMSLDEKDAENIKKNRVFQNLDNKDAVSFLTKDIPTQYIEFMASLLRSEIHKQTFIPDLDQLTFGGAVSGVGIDKFIYQLEYPAGDKQAYFTKALRERIDLIDTITTIQDKKDIKIFFSRNKPSADITNADIYQKLDGRGISRESLMLEYMPWIEDPEAELKKYDKEQETFKDVELEGEIINEQTNTGISINSAVQKNSDEEATGL